MRIYLLFIVVLMLFVPLAFSADLIYSEDFEGTDYQDSFRGAQWSYLARIDTLAHGGSYCLRGNLLNSVTDPIAGVQGNNLPTLEFDADAAIAATADSGEVYVSFWRRLDSSSWDGSVDGWGKDFWVTDITYSTGAFYMGNPDKETTPDKSYSFYGNGAWDEWNYATWGSYYQALDSPELYGFSPLDNEWHKYAIYVNYTETNHYIMIWVDDILLVDPSMTDGKIYCHSDFVMRGLQLVYAATGQIEDSTDGTDPVGYACGYQYDDFLVYDGLPSAPAPASAPSSLTATRTAQ